MSLDQISRDHRDAGSVNSLLAVWGFVDDTTFLTKAGHLGVAYRVDGIDYERLTHDQRAGLVHQFVAALRLLDERWRVYQYLIKRTIAPVQVSPCASPVAFAAIDSDSPRTRRIFAFPIAVTFACRSPMNFEAAISANPDPHGCCIVNPTARR